MTSGEKSQTIEINVVDVSMPENAKIKAESIRQDDHSTIDDETILDNTNMVEFVEDSNNNTYKGNVNLMDDATIGENTEKFYRARFLVEGFDNKNLVAIDQTSMKILKTEPVPNTQNEIYVYLSANYSKTDLVIKTKEAIDSQVKAHTPFVVNFESTSVLWIDKENPAVSGGVRLAPVISMGSTVSANQSSEDGPITKVELDEHDETLVKIGAKISEIKEYSFDKTNLKEDTTGTENKGKWIGIDLRVINHNDNINTTASVTCDDTNVIIDNGTNQKSQVGIKPGLPRVIYVWFKVEKEGDTTFTLKFNSNGVAEELPITFRVYDASKPELTVNTIDKSGNNSAVTDINVNSDNTEVTFNTFKYAMTSSSITVDGEEKTGRFYTLNFTTSVPVDSLVYKIDSDSTFKPIENKTSENSFSITLDANKDYSQSGLKITFANIHGKYTSSQPDTTDNNKVFTLKPVDISKTSLKTTNNDAISGVGLKISDELAALNLKGVTVQEPNRESKPTLLNNLKQSQKLTTSSGVSTSYDVETDKLTSVLTVDSSDFNELIVTSPNGTTKEGKWILTTVLVKGDIQTLINDSTADESAAFIDADNSTKLLSNAIYTENGNNWYKLVVWINLSSDKIKAVTSKTDTETAEAYEIKFKSTSPVEESNSFFIKIKDTNKMQELTKEDVEEVGSTASSEDYLNATENKKANFSTNVMGWNENNDQLTTDDMQAVAHNIQILEQSKKDIEIHDDTVYMTLTGNWTNMKKDSGKGNSLGEVYSIPLSFDISMLNYTGSNGIYSWCSKRMDNSGRAFSKDFNANNLLQSQKTTWSTPFRFKETDAEWKELKQNGKCTFELILTKTDMTSNNECKKTFRDALDYLRTKGKDYVCYVITLVQEN